SRREHVMQFVSTRDREHAVTLSEAISRGLAPDSGLYVPETFPTLDPAQLGEDTSLASVGEWLLRPFFEGDRLAGALGDICRHAFDFPVPLEPLRRSTAVLELFH